MLSNQIFGFDLQNVTFDNLDVPNLLKSRAQIANHASVDFHSDDTASGIRKVMRQMPEPGAHFHDNVVRSNLGRGNNAFEDFLIDQKVLTKAFLRSHSQSVQ